MFRLLSFLIIFISACNAHNLSVVKGSVQHFKQKNQHDDVINILPKTTTPISYDISFNFNLDVTNVTFEGTVKILMKVNVDNLFEIKLNAKDLKFEKENVVINKINAARADPKFEIENVEFEEEMVTISIANKTDTMKLDKDSKYEIIISNYIGNFQNDNKGVYRTADVDDKSKTIPLIATQFEPIHARKAFPCYDEPSYKAKFDLKIESEEMYHAISNMNQMTTTSVGGRRTTSFHTSEIMSSYLVAFVISNYDSKANDRFRVFATKTRIDDVYYALGVGEKILTGFETLLEENYTLPKLDQIAIPGMGGAMENWGLVTYGPSFLLYNSDRDSKSQQQKVIKTISHEFAHQYFGNLVTQEWWNFIWLSEGFAQLFSYLMSEIEYPEFKFEDSFVVDAMQKVFYIDALLDSRAMTSDASSSSEILKLFDSIAYDKAACVLNMLRHAFTDEVFIQGLKNYIEAGKFKTANDKLLSDSLNKPVKEFKIFVNEMTFATVEMIMDTWTKQAGYPIVTVILNLNEGSYNMSQERYLTDFPNDEQNTTWFVPYNYITKTEATKSKDLYSNTFPDDWLYNIYTFARKIVHEYAKTDWIIFNRQQTGYYRVNYDKENWNRIIDELITGSMDLIHPLNRAQLIDDSFNFANTERIEYEIFLSLFSYLKNEKEFLPWSTAEFLTKILDIFLTDSEMYAEYSRFIRLLTHHLYDELGMTEIPDEAYQKTQLRKLIINLACKYGNVKCALDALFHLRTEIDKPTGIAPNLKYAIINAGVRRGSDIEFNYVWRLFQSTADEIERNEYIFALTSSENGTQLSEILSYILLDDGVEVNGGPLTLSQTDRVKILMNVIQNKEVGLEAATEFLETNHVKVNEKFKDQLDNILSVYADRIAKAERIEKLKAILDKLEYKNKDEILKKSEKAVEWIEKNKPTFKKYFDEHLCDDDGGSGTVIISMYAIILSIFVTLYLF